MIENTILNNLIIMLEKILNLRGVEVLSINQQKNVMGSGNGNGTAICTIPWTPLPYYGPCIMEAQIKPVEPICKATIDGIECL
ncbi:hypothetical protein [Flavobacterium pectinovorum]|uniref:Uncharacterized protein n=1 Tax=Flavobacterium pectinovorum TaxID=29533 RepID=A0A502F7Q8_9FLAO|nr:hypothetical protein [Flavobacterium pectinovorum]TPG45417.1 hypothetical protein EAH81_02105 [Flavobacterium pectinovorum]